MSCTFIISKYCTMMTFLLPVVMHSQPTNQSVGNTAGKRQSAFQGSALPTLFMLGTCDWVLGDPQVLGARRYAMSERWPRSSIWIGPVPPRDDKMRRR